MLIAPPLHHCLYAICDTINLLRSSQGSYVIAKQLPVVINVTYIEGTVKVKNPRSKERVVWISRKLVPERSICQRNILKLVWTETENKFLKQTEFTVCEPKQPNDVGRRQRGTPMMPEQASDNHVEEIEGLFVV